MKAGSSFTANDIQSRDGYCLPDTFPHTHTHTHTGLSIQEPLNPQTGNAHNILVGKREGKRTLGTPRRRWKDNIGMDLREVG